MKIRKKEMLHNKTKGYLPLYWYSISLDDAVVLKIVVREHLQSLT